MKYIKKQAEPKALIAWKAMACEDWQPSYKNLSGELKKTIKSSLIFEQGGICCYCERRLSYTGSHIEHFCPQSLPDVDPLEYNNMLCSCLNQEKTGAPLCCGHKKHNWYDSDLLISPLDPDCEKRFKFLGNGEIKARIEGDQAATETIKRLGLNINLLIAARKAVIDSFLDEEFTNKDFSQFVNDYLAKKKMNQFNEFWTTIRDIFSKDMNY